MTCHWIAGHDLLFNGRSWGYWGLTPFRLVFIYGSKLFQFMLLATRLDVIQTITTSLLFKLEKEFFLKEKTINLTQYKIPVCQGTWPARRLGLGKEAKIEWQIQDLMHRYRQLQTTCVLSAKSRLFLEGRWLMCDIYLSNLLVRQLLM